MPHCLLLASSVLIRRWAAENAAAPAQEGSGVGPRPHPQPHPYPDHPRASGEHKGRRRAHLFAQGSSPRRRGARAGHRLGPPKTRIIPAQAGSTDAALWSHSAPQDHPRAGGEHSRRWVRAFGPSGSSPRRRGARLDGRGEPARRGIIPAQAGSTISDHDPPPAGQDHPRAGGEHLAQEEQVSASEGSSPRRRGARLRLHVLSDVRGIIPAQAGSTTPSSGRRCRGRDHPRAGGEHVGPDVTVPLAPGSSPRRRGAPGRRCRRGTPRWIIPRRRGALLRERAVDPGRGIIPAQAGSTVARPGHWGDRTDHPRAGGEHVTAAIRDVFARGSSPRRRGALPKTSLERSLSGIIPAQAGSTPRGVSRSRLFPDHPRAGGEHLYWASPPLPSQGSSPRRRGARRVGWRTSSPCRIIPAQAGSTGVSDVSMSAISDHPRAGGKHHAGPRYPSRLWGSSPSRRGALPGAFPGADCSRIIPAQAGSTCTGRAHRSPVRDQPRAGGEHGVLGGEPVPHAGSSPRRRGARRPDHRYRRVRRIIPAQAGSTGVSDVSMSAISDHPRAGGKHHAGPRYPSRLWGSSPRRRGARKDVTLGHLPGGIIPAQAGSTP